ncbi:MAG TPA: DUF4197 domain-containing protein [Flavisolibacter sp.]|jgi:hypothetical protein|nr:DUF4197 domain-containing protein [Flavisolibacter sp.]
MKKFFVFTFFASTLAINSQAQFKNILKKDSSGKSGISKIIQKTTSSSSLSNDEIVQGLKEALSVGANNASKQLSFVDGFFKDAAIKILMPPEAVKAEKKLRSLGMGKLVDDAILSMNRAAEDASKNAAPIFVNAIKQMSIQDAVGILRGNDTAATGYLKNKTTSPLTEAFRPVIETSLAKVNATKYWNTVFSTYNKFSSDKINPDLAAYVTEKSLSGIFHQVGLEEQKIRKDPMARTTDILKKVFAK